VLAASVVMGNPNAPTLGLLVVLAPLGALLAASRDHARPAALTVLVGGIVVSVVLTGSILATVDAAVALGFPADQALAGAVILVLVGMLARGVVLVSSVTLLLGIVALAMLIAAIAMGTGAPPWVAWTRLASQPMLVFSTTSAWVTGGRSVLRTTTLVFTETQRITAVRGAVVRVTAHASDGGTVREWHLGTGDSLAIRAGDHLTLSPGSRMKFEAGKRIPGLATSGVAWATPRERPWADVLGGALGLAVTLGGGAVALLSRPGRISGLDAVAAPVFTFAFALGAASWGVYAAWLTADLSIGHSPLASLMAVPFASVPHETPTELTALIAFIFAALLVATAASLTGRLDGLVAGWALQHAWVRLVPILVAVVAVTGGVGLAFRGVEAEGVLRLGLGVAASAWAAPRVGGVGRGIAVGTFTGGGVFAALSLATPFGLTGTSAVGHYPALVAGPLAALCAVLARRTARGRVARRRQAVRVGCPEEGTLPQ
jgi:hypothetical protein